MADNRTLDERVEAAAQLIHERAHRLGYGQVCDRCRQTAEAIRKVFECDR